MNQQLTKSCNDSEPKQLITYTFDGKETTKNLCQNCINFIKKSVFGKIISESPLEATKN